MRGWLLLSATVLHRRLLVLDLLVSQESLEGGDAAAARELCTVRAQLRVCARGGGEGCEARVRGRGVAR